MCFTIFQNEKTPFYAKKRRSSSSRKIDIFPKGLTNGFGSKIAIFGSKIAFSGSKVAIFFQVFFLGKLHQENVFYDILERVNAFLCYQNKKFKKLKNWHFSNGLTHGFCQKITIFPIFSFYAIYSRKMSLTIFQKEKTPFQALKT